MARTPRRSAGGRRSQPSTPRAPRTPRTPRTAGMSATPATPSSGRGTNGLFLNGQWLCDCNPRRPAALLETQKRGPNKGRWFYTCPQERRRQCTFFLWEDYAGVSGGAGNGAHGGAGAAGPSTAPRPTYRMSIGRRTTPPLERRQDGFAPAPTPTAQPIARPPTGQRALPPPMVQPTSVGRQRIFKTPLGGARTNAFVEDDEEEDDGYDEPPATPTPMRTRHSSNGGSVSTSASASAPESASAATRPRGLAEPARVQPPNHSITKYFGVVKKGGPSAAKETGPDVKVESESTPPAVGLVRNASDYSDSEFDSDMDRALVALADHSERARRRSAGDLRPTGRAETRVKIKQEEADDIVNMEPNTEMEVDGGSGGRRGIIVPLREEGLSPTRPSGGSRRRGLLVASDEYAAKEAAAAAATGTLPATTAGTATNTPPMSFSALFGSNGNDGIQQRQYLQQQGSQQPLANRSFSSSSQLSSFSQTSTQGSVDTTTLTTPPSSFRSDAGGSNTGGSQKLGLPRNPWYGDDTTQSVSDGGGWEAQVQANGGNASDGDPFTSTPSKRVRFFGVGHAADNEGTETLPASGQSQSQSDSTQRQRWDEDEGMHLDEEEGDEVLEGEELAEEDREGEGDDEGEEKGASKGKGKEKDVFPRRRPKHKPKDHNVTLAVLQLLASQPVEPRVRQQVRALLNSAFDEYGV